EAVDAPDAVHTRLGYQARGASQQLLDESVALEIAADDAVAVGILRQYDAAAVDHQDAAGGGGEVVGDTPEPVTVDQPDTHAVNVAVVADERQGAGDGRSVGAGAEEIIADHEVAGPHRADEMRALRDVEADGIAKARADDAALRIGDRQRLN